MAFDVDNDDAPVNDDKAVGIANNDDSNSESSECFNDSDDDNNDDKCCTGSLCCYTIGKWKAKKDQNSKCFKCSGMCHDICCKLIGRIIKLFAKCEDQHKAVV